jgi:hypothetical protein
MCEILPQDVGKRTNLKMFSEFCGNYDMSRTTKKKMFEHYNMLDHIYNSLDTPFEIQTKESLNKTYEWLVYQNNLSKNSIFEYRLIQSLVREVFNR